MRNQGQLEIPADLPEGWGYIAAKAERCLELGDEAFRACDPLGTPMPWLDDEDRALIRAGMEQILRFSGYRPDAPFTGLGVGGFYALMDTLHFRTESQQAERHDDHMLDTMHVRHLSTRKGMVFYNRVEARSGPAGPRRSRPAQGQAGKQRERA